MDTFDASSTLSSTTQTYSAAAAPAAPPVQNASCETPSACLTLAKKVLQQEAEAIQDMRERLAEEFDNAIELMLACSGKIVVTGMGKSGHIGCKIAATLASTGSPAFFVHPAELRHGDFGMLEERDLVLALSSSGETQEIKLALDPIKRLGIKIIAMTGNNASTLARFSDVVLDTRVEREACPFNLAPTSSTTACLAMGDALAIVLMTRKNFRLEDFARAHPGGNLGRQLVTVESIMRGGQELPSVSLNSDYQTILNEVDRKRLGFTAVCEESGRLAGIITDGDLRRAVLKWGKEVFAKTASQIMSPNPRTISSNSLAVEALRMMEKHSISDLLIVDVAGKPIAVIHLKDLLQAGII